MNSKEPVVVWTSDSISSKPVEIFEPDAPGERRGVVIFLHGYDGVTLRANPAYTNELNRHLLAAVCPLGPECWWSDRIYPLFDPDISPVEFLAQQLPGYCQMRWNCDATKIGVTGVEMGGQGALQLSYRYARRFPVVVAISPKVDFETWHGHGTSLDEIFPNREAARQATATLHIHPLDWPKHQLLLCDPADQYCIEGVHTLASKLSSTGIPFESDFVSTHGGFGWNYANAMAGRVIEFLASHMS
jgi:S-formylglutathione hydrolase